MDDIRGSDFSLRLVWGAGGLGGAAPRLELPSDEEVLRLEPGCRVSTQSRPAKRSCNENRRGAPLAGIRLFSLQGRCRVAQVAIPMPWPSAAVLLCCGWWRGEGAGGVGAARPHLRFVSFFEGGHFVTGDTPDPGFFLPIDLVERSGLKFQRSVLVEKSGL